MQGRKLHIHIHHIRRKRGKNIWRGGLLRRCWLHWLVPLDKRHVPQEPTNSAWQRCVPKRGFACHVRGPLPEKFCLVQRRCSLCPRNQTVKYDALCVERKRANHKWRRYRQCLLRWGRFVCPRLPTHRTAGIIADQQQGRSQSWAPHYDEQRSYKKSSSHKDQYGQYALRNMYSIVLWWAFLGTRHRLKYRKGREF